MATRYAGDYFGIPLSGVGSGRGSLLLSYYPELRSVKKQAEAEARQQPGARSFRGARAVGPFTGFKTMRKDTTFKALPAFSGFKEL